MVSIHLPQEHTLWSSHWQGLWVAGVAWTDSPRTHNTIFWWARSCWPWQWTQQSGGEWHFFSDFYYCKWGKLHYCHLLSCLHKGVSEKMFSLWSAVEDILYFSFFSGEWAAEKSWWNNSYVGQWPEKEENGQLCGYYHCGRPWFVEFAVSINFWKHWTITTQKFSKYWSSDISGCCIPLVPVCSTNKN